MQRAQSDRVLPVHLHHLSTLLLSTQQLGHCSPFPLLGFLIMEKDKKKKKKKLGTFPVPSVEQPQPAKPSLQLLDEALFPHHPSLFRDLCWKQRLLHFSCQFHWKKKSERKTNCALWYLGKLSLQGNVIFSSLFDCKCVNLFNCIIDQHSTYNYYHCIMDWKKFAATACVIRYALVTNF